MDSVTRRRFLLASGVVGAGALAAGGSTIALSSLFETPEGRVLGGRPLVVVTLYGGNDGLNTVIPYTDKAYHAARPDLAYTETLTLGSGLGLNPKMLGFKKLWDAGKLAIVRGAGYPKPNRSHFSSMDIWQTGSPDSPVDTGWLGRWLDATKGGPLDAISFEPVLPPLLAGSTVAGGSVPLKGFTSTSLVTGLAGPGGPSLRDRVSASYTDLLAVRKLAVSVDTDEPGEDAEHEQGPLAAQLDMTARCIEAGAQARVYSVSLGGFDTHAVEKAASERLLGEVDAAVSAFAARVPGAVVLVYSEFGRRVRGNGSDGTDHGTAGPAFVIGGNGGFFGQQPSLTDLDRGDLKATTDFRDIYGSLLSSVLNTDPGKVLNGWQGRVPGLF
ncbi:DUF1501 domain-containing protein [Longispora albida]|uniref:DUF1501 domain-containing protein n=1 Tax=Longispora albida TaxID=203523 RepID=UPI00039F23F4|nr:DUF1501 domain-containing protein [Longispora albida]